MRTLVVFCFTVFMIAGLSSVHASTLSSTSYALNDGNGPSAGVWQGSQNYSGSLFGDVLDADVEFAVFPPGSFQDFLSIENNIAFVDPAPGEYIYAYQVSVAPATTSVTNFSVGLQNDEALGLSGVTFIPMATNYGGYAPLPTVDPSPGAVGGGPGVDFSSVWGHNNPVSLPAGGASTILFYSSPQVPELGFATVNAGFAGQFLANSLPNPSTIPEPSTLVLCLAVGLGLVCRRRL